MLRLYFKTIIKLILCLVVALFVFSIIGLILQSNFDIKAVYVVILFNVLKN